MFYKCAAPIPSSLSSVCSIRDFYIALCIVPSSNNRFDTLRWSQNTFIRCFRVSKRVDVYSTYSILIQLWDSIHKISHKLTIVGGFFLLFVRFWDFGVLYEHKLEHKNETICLEDEQQLLVLTFIVPPHKELNFWGSSFACCGMWFSCLKGINDEKFCYPTLFK